MMFTAKIKVMPKSGVLDPQGKAVMHSLETLGFKGVDDARIGKLIEIKLDAPSQSAAMEIATSMCQSLLANQVIETFEIDIS